MNTTKLKLTNPTDDELSAAVAEHVAHAAPPKGDDYMWAFKREGGLTLCSLPPFATSADAVLPLLEKCASWMRCGSGSVWVQQEAAGVECGAGGSCDEGNMSFPRAACLALLRANGIEVE